MKGESQFTDFQHTTRLALLIALTVLTVVLIVENLLMGWEGWMLPILVGTFAGSWIIMIQNRLAEDMQLRLFCTALMLETFYYGVHSETVFRIAPVAIVGVMLYTLTMNRRIVWCGIAAGYFTTFFRLWEEIAAGTSDLSPENIFITIAHFSLLTFAGFVCLRFIRLWETLGGSFQEQMKLLSEEREKINDFLINVSSGCFTGQRKNHCCKLIRTFLSLCCHMIAKQGAVCSFRHAGVYNKKKQRAKAGDSYE